MTTPILSYAAPDDPLPKSLLIRGIERLTGRRRLERRYAATRTVDGDAFWNAALEQLDVTIDVNRPPSTVFPDRGPLVVVANHPFGVLDGLALCHLVSRVRPRFRILINRVLCRDDRFDDAFLPVDFSGTPEGRRTNRRTIRSALVRLQEEGTVALFPAGGIATASGLRGPATDLSWKPLAAKLVQATEATVVPVYFAGQNSRLFQWASHISLTLRLALIVREVLRKTGDTLSVRMGAPIPSDDLAEIDDPDRLTAHLRDRTLRLGREVEN
jgi:putative hemolysin